MVKKLEHVEAAINEAIRLGATLETEYCTKHITGIISFNGKQRKIFFSKSPSTSNVAQITKLDVRRKVKEMS